LILNTHLYYIGSDVVVIVC